MQHQALLASYLRQLRFPTFAQNYQAFAQDAIRTNLSYERYLLALCQAEAEQREANRIERAIINAKFPIVKELASFDFSAVQGISKTRVLELAQGGYLSKAENIILMGNPGLGKSHIATGLALAACRQGKRVRFFGCADEARYTQLRVRSPTRVEVGKATPYLERKLKGKNSMARVRPEEIST